MVQIDEGYFLVAGQFVGVARSVARLSATCPAASLHRVAGTMCVSDGRLDLTVAEEFGEHWQAHIQGQCAQCVAAA